MNPTSATEQPIVSVIVPTYQHAAYIKECLDGILSQQTTFPIEVLVGEDESTDGTREICQGYAQAYPDRIHLFLRSRKDVIHINGKPTGRSNIKALLASVRGRYVAICEGDDHWIDPLKLQKQVDIMERDAGVSLVFHNVWVKHEASRYDYFLNQGLVGDRFGASQVFSMDWFVGTASICARSGPLKRALEGFDFALTGDMLLQFHAALEGDFYYLDDVASVYRRNAGGVSAAYWSTTGRDSEVAKFHHEVFRPNQIWVLFRVGLQVSDGQLRAVINQRIGCLAEIVMRHLIGFHAPNVLFTIEDLIDRFRNCMSTNAPPDEQDPKLLGDPEVVDVIEKAAASIWGLKAEANLRSVCADGHPIACIRLCLRMFNKRQYARSVLIRWAALCIPWYFQGVLFGKDTATASGK